MTASAKPALLVSIIGLALAKAAETENCLGLESSTTEDPAGCFFS